MSGTWVKIKNVVNLKRLKKTMIKYFVSNKRKNKIFVPYALAKSFKLYKKRKGSHIKKSNHKFEGQLRAYQIPVKKQIDEWLKEKPNFILNEMPGFGKTLMSLVVSADLKYRTLIITQRINLSEQFEKEFNSHFSGKVHFIKSNEVTVDDADVYIVSTNRIRDRKIDKKFLKTIGTLILDEIHLACGSMKQFMSWATICPKYVIGLTATVERHGDDHHLRLNAIFGSKYVYSGFTKGILNWYVIKTKFKPENRIEYSKFLRRNALRYDLFLKSIVVDKKRNALIVSKILEELKKNNKIIVISTRVGHLDKISKILSKLGIRHAKYYGKHEDYKATDNIILGSDKKIATGFDASNATKEKGPNGEKIKVVPFNVLLMVTTITSKVTLLQAFGRVMRSFDPYVYWFLDDSNTSRNHLRAGEKVMKNYNSKMKKDKDKI